MSPTDQGVWVRVRVAPARTDAAAIERVGPLTPYLVQTVVEDAVAGGRGTTVHLQLRDPAPGWSPSTLQRLRRSIQLLAGSEVQVALVDPVGRE